MRLFFIVAASVFLTISAAAVRKNSLNVYQLSLKPCLDKKIDLQKIDNNKNLYKVIEQNYTLLTSETTYREVLFKLKSKLKKLKFEAGRIQIFDVDADENLSLVSTEKIGEMGDGYLVRQKKLSPESRINQLLFQADIRSDLQIIKEKRTKQVELNITWSDSEIKNMSIDFKNENSTLVCSLKDSLDICICRL